MAINVSSSEYKKDDGQDEPQRNSLGALEHHGFIAFFTKEIASTKKYKEVIARHGKVDVIEVQHINGTRFKSYPGLGWLMIECPNGFYEQISMEESSVDSLS